jgi:DNA-binding NtrC family response regulator
MRVLIVDDDEVISGAVFHHLNATGVDTDLALDPPAAERLLKANDYSLILMDAYLTGQVNSGALALVDRVGQLRPGSSIVVLTAYASDQLAERVARNPRITLVNKPKSVTYITDLIGTMLEARGGNP